MQRHITDYQPQLEKAIAAIEILRSADPDSETFSQALADLHVAATILEPYSEGIVEAAGKTSAKVKAVLGCRVRLIFEFFNHAAAK